MKTMCRGYHLKTHVLENMYSSCTVHELPQSHFGDIFMIHDYIYHVYSSECSGCSFNFGLSKGGTYLREALIKYTKKTLKYL